MNGFVMAGSGTMFLMLFVMLGMGLQMGSVYAQDGQSWSAVNQNLTNITDTVEENMTAAESDGTGPPGSDTISSTAVFYADWAVGVSRIGAVYGYRWPLIGQYLALPTSLVGLMLPAYNAYSTLKS